MAAEKGTFENPIEVQESDHDRLASRLVAKGIPAEAISTGGNCEAVVASTPNFAHEDDLNRNALLDVFVGEDFWSVITVTNLSIDLTHTQRADGSYGRWTAQLADEQQNEDGLLADAHAWYGEQMLDEAGGEDWSIDQLEAEFVRQWNAALTIHDKAVKDFTAITKRVEAFANLEQDEAFANLLEQMERAVAADDSAKQNEVLPLLLDAARTAGKDYFTYRHPGGGETVEEYEQGVTDDQKVEGRWEAHYLPPCKPSVAEDDTDDEMLTITACREGEVFDGATVTNVETGAVVGILVHPQTYEQMQRLTKAIREQQDAASLIPKLD